METLIRGPLHRQRNHGEIVTTIDDLTITRLAATQSWSRDEYRVVAPDTSCMSVGEMIAAAPWQGGHDCTKWHDLDSAVAYARKCVAEREAKREAMARMLAERTRLWPTPRPCRISRRRLSRIKAGTRAHAAVCADASAILGIPVRMATAYTSMGYYPAAIATVDGVDVPLSLDGEFATLADDTVTVIR